MKQVIDIQKYKTDQEITHIANHNLRQVASRNVRKSKTKDNIYFAGNSKMDVVAEMNKKLAVVPKFRKDANKVVNLVLSASPEFFQNATQEDIKKWASESHKWAEETFGKDNILYSVLHQDETTPHIHLALVPIFEGKLRSNHWFDGPMKLKKIHDSYAKISKKFGISRGQKKVKSSPEELESYYTKVNASTIYERKLDNKLDELFEKIDNPTLSQKLNPWAFMKEVVKPLMTQLSKNLSHYRTKNENNKSMVKELEEKTARVADLELKMEMLGLDPNMKFIECQDYKVVSALAESPPLSEDKAYHNPAATAYKAGAKVKLK